VAVAGQQRKIRAARSILPAKSSIVHANHPLKTVDFLPTMEVMKLGSAGVMMFRMAVASTLISSPGPKENVTIHFAFGPNS
jgi:hypothetical protein